MAFLDVFHHRYLELARQADDRRRRQEGQGDPAGAEDIGGAADGVRMDVLEHVGDAVRDAVGDEDADGDQRQQLDDGLQRDGRDDAVMPFVGIQVSGPE